MSVPEFIRSVDPQKRRVQFSGRLYFWAAAMPTLAATFEATAKYDYWPSLPRIAACILAGVASGIIAVKAYHDGSAQPSTTTETRP